MLRIAAFTLALALGALASGSAMAKKICTNTYHADGTRCTFCYYTTQPGSGSTNCIKIKAPSGSSSSQTKSPSALKLAR